MKKKQTIIMTGMIIVVLVCGLSFGEEKVEGEKDDSKISFVSKKGTSEYIKPSYRAEFFLDGDYWPSIKNLLETEAYKRMSDIQKDYLEEQLYYKKRHDVSGNRKVSGSHTAIEEFSARNNMRGWYVRAVSEDDVKKMADAWLEVAKKYRIKRIQRAKDAIKEYSEKMEQVQAKIVELEKELKPVVEKRAAYEKELNPSLLKGDEAIIKIHDQLDEYKIKLRGIEARKQAIDRTQHILNERLKAMDPSRISSERQAINTLRIKYDEMQADLEIERAGIRAEKEMLEERLDTVQTYWKLTERDGKLSRELKSQKASLSKLRKSHENGVEYLQKLESQPIEIVDNEVVVSKI